MATYDLKYPGAAIDAILDTAYDLQNAGYIFRGLAAEYSNTPTERSWVLAGEGETGHGFTSPVPKGYVGVCVFNGTSWTGKLLKCVSIDSTPTNGSTNAVSSGGAYTSISQLATTVNEALDNLTFTDTTPSAFLGNYIKMKVSTTDGGIERIMTYFTILAATAEKAGLMSAADKQKLDAMLGNLRSLEIDDTTAYADLGTKIVESIKATIGGTEETISTFQILAATASKAGLLSAADKAKLDALWSSGYQFAGIATPSTTPISTTSKIFYIATEAGTYFNAVTVTQGINLLSWNGTSWSAVQVVGIDDEPMQDSENLIRSGGVYPIMQESAQNTADISNINQLDAISTVTGKYINSNGTENTNSSYQYQIFSVSGGKKYTFSCRFNGGNIYIVHWFNGSTYLGKESYRSGVGVEYVDKVLIAPDDADTCIINQSINYYNQGYYNFKEVLETIKSLELKKSVDNAFREISDARGNYFTYADCMILYSNGTMEEGHPGLKATDFLPITGKEQIICKKLWTNGTTIAMLAFYDADKNFISGIHEPNGEQDLTIAVEDIPQGAKFIRASANFLREGPHTIVGGVSFASIVENVEALDINITEVTDAVTENICTQMAVSNTLEGGFIKSNGDFMANSSYHVDIYNVDGDGLYAFSGSFIAGANLYFLSWFDENSEFIKIEPYHGSTTEATSFVNQVVKAPSNAAYLYLNVLTSRSSYFNASSVVQQIIKSSDLKEELDGIKADAGIMKVAIQGDNISIRTALNIEQDLIIKFGKDSNGNISPKTTLIGNTDDYDAEFVEIHKWSDSTMPLRSVPQFWHLYAAHGIPIPLVTVTDNPLTSDDVGSWWQDQENRQYQVGKVLGNKIYLIPRVVQSGTQGIVTRDWRDSSKDTYPSELQHVSGAVHTDTLTVASASQYQVEPIQAPSNKMLICDGKVVSDGTYFCNEFVVSETLTCLDVTAMTSYFPTPTSSRNALVITNSFIFKGLSIGFNQLVNCVNPVQFGYYGSNQAQHLADTDELDAYVLIPKVKKNNSAGSIMNRFFRSQDSDSNVTVYRTADDLVDIDKLPDRQLSVLKDGDTPLIGFASGVSLVRGITVDEVRNTFIAKSAGSAGNALLFSPTNNNKFYVGVVSAYNTAKFTNQLMQTDFCKEFSTYYSYFMPTGDVQTYWYYDGTSTIIYIHAESNTGTVMVDVSKAGCEGKGLEIVEKTDDVTLYSDSIVNGKICVEFNSSDANYIVIKAN